MSEKKVSRRRFVKYAVGGVVVLAGAAAGVYYASRPTPAPTETTTLSSTSNLSPTVTIPRPDELVIDNPTFSPYSWDPCVAWDIGGATIVWNMYDRLFAVGKTEGVTTPEPWLLDDWNSPDGKTFTFHLYPNIKFHNGDALDSAAVKYSLERALTLSGLGTGGYIASAIGNKNPRFSTSDELTVKLELDTPVNNEILLGALSVLAGSIVNPKLVEAHGGVVTGKENEWMRDNEAGSGPFTLGEFVSADHVVMMRFDGYFKEKAGVSKITVRSVPEIVTQIIHLRKGH